MYWNRNQSQSWTLRSSGSRGYTLNEMLIIMAVLATLAAVAWPALRKPLAKQQLKSAAKQLRAELARTRLEAIQTGQALQFKYVPGTGTFCIEPLDADLSTEGELVRNGGMSIEPDFPRIDDFDRSLDDDPADLESPDEELQESEEQQLPQEIKFAPDEEVAGNTLIETAVDDPYGLQDDAELLDGSQLLGEPALLRPEDWSTPIVFYPNGRTSNAEIQLVGDRDYRIQLQLRGVTGAIVVGVLQNPPKESEDGLTVEDLRVATAPKRNVQRPSPSSSQDLWRGSIHGIQTNRAPTTP